MLATGVPAAFLGVDEVETGVDGAIEADVVEDEKFGFGPEVGRVSQARILEVHLGLLGDVAGIAFVFLAGERIEDVAEHHKRRDLRERIEERRRRIRDEQHVAFIDRRPAADGTAVDAEAGFEAAFVQLIDGITDVVGEAGDVGKAEIHLADFVLFGVLEDFFWGHGVIYCVRNY